MERSKSCRRQNSLVAAARMERSKSSGCSRSASVMPIDGEVLVRFPAVVVTTAAGDLKGSLQSQRREVLCMTASIEEAVKRIEGAEDAAIDVIHSEGQVVNPPSFVKVEQEGDFHVQRVCILDMKVKVLQK